jgi:hypothetical protein
MRKSSVLSLPLQLGLHGKIVLRSFVYTLQQDYQGTLTKGKGRVQLLSLLRQLVLYGVKKLFQKAAGLNYLVQGG